MKKNKITIVGSGYVGMSLGVLLSQKNNVVMLDIDPVRVEKINKKESTVADDYIKDFLANKKLELSATISKEIAYKRSDFIIIATPTNYDPITNNFDTSTVDSVVDEALKINSDALIVIKSTIPVGHTEFLQKKYTSKRIIFSPEFLREGHALKDNLYPSRIIIGSRLGSGKTFGKLLIDSAFKKDVETLYISSREAEAVKLFANTFLAMRVSFFNELDSFALVNDLDTKNIIDGVCLDDRIGKGYNNPSFGYGGYCLPKDTKQLLANYEHVPQTLMQAIVSSNAIRKDFIAKSIIELKPKTIGIYRLVMKQGSDNYRESAIQGVMERVKDAGIKIVIYEPSYNQSEFLSIKVMHSLREFKNISDLIVANRFCNELDDVSDKIFSRDLFGVN